MEDVRARRGADVASDHHLVSAENRPKLQNHWITGETTLLSCISVFLQDTDKSNEFKMALNNKFREAEIASDHHLVVAKIKLKLKKQWTTGQTALQSFN
ncbi:unnamed protein product [Schistosoma mattheei]|uniref:Uncharacterized protein n=1 Tax=Schistosoma mattheei TaxID=31246 RepID=A0A183PDY6_9TREM|nr:unnamed protein product [Schistosoma mattheei]